MEYMPQKILKSDKITIVVDSREGNSSIIDLLEEEDATIKKVSLGVGDYSVSDRVCIERKTSDDFINSIIDGRLFQQLEEMKDNFSKPILLIEGNFFRETMNKNALKAAMASVILDYEIPIIMTEDEEDTAKTIYWLARREQTDSKRPVAMKRKKKPKDIKKLQEHIISGFPGVSTVLGERILKKFKTIKGFAGSPAEEIKKVDGVGEVLAKKLEKILNKKYR